MRIIIITAEHFLYREAQALTALLDAGAWRVHVRKPGAHADDVSALLEAVPAGQCDYMFLSPVFDSISKRGYSSHFSLEDIKSNSGIVKDRVFALGGVSADNIGLLPDAGFGGAAVLGFLWEPYKHDRDVQNLVRRLRSILDVFKN